MPEQPEQPKPTIEASPAGHWTEKGFEPGLNATDAFKKEFEKK